MNSTQESSSAVPLPPGFKTIEEIKNLPNDLIKAGVLVDVFGFIKDYQPPMPTRGSDWICTLEILDESTRYENHGLKVVIFWPVKRMPAVTGARDIVVLRKGRVQMRSGQIQLLANKASEFHLLPSKLVPPFSNPASLPWSSYRFEDGKFKLPDATETRYILGSNDHVKDIELPSDHEFEEKVKQAMTIKDKFSLLKDVKPENFYNILGQVIRVYESNGNLSLYLTDYTAHSKFYNYVWGEDIDTAARDGDEYGYIKSKNKAAKSWPGPFGKLTMQLTLYDSHAEFVRENVNVDDWVLLSNVQIKFGKIGGMLEGFLRGDRYRFEGKIQVKILEKSEDPDDNDDRWKEAVRRKHEWWKKFKEQRQDILDDAAGVGSKRKNGDEPEKGGSKKRRQERRALAAKKAEESKVNLAKKLDLNENIQCAFPDLPIVSFQDILKPQILLREDKTDEKFSPFTLCKYKANVRVVDYFPRRIEDFAVGHKPSEMDMLSDYSGDEDTDHEEDLRIFRSGKGFSKKVWEWRFALQVEDASTKDSKERLWLMVDNNAAQGLLNLEADASNLRGNQQLLSDVKEQLFKLWGDLEEQKSAALPNQAAKSKKETPPSSFQSSALSPPPQAGGQPDLNSDDESSSILKERNINLPTTAAESTAESKVNTNIAPRNKAFTCCIKQYGIKVEEDDPTIANAGEGFRWQRMFGLFETYIT